MEVSKATGDEGAGALVLVALCGRSPRGPLQYLPAKKSSCHLVIHHSLSNSLQLTRLLDDEQLQITAPTERCCYTASRGRDAGMSTLVVSFQRSTREVRDGPMPILTVSYCGFQYVLASDRQAARMTCRLSPRPDPVQVPASTYL